MTGIRSDIAFHGECQCGAFPREHANARRTGHTCQTQAFRSKGASAVFGSRSAGRGTIWAAEDRLVGTRRCKRDGVRRYGA
jgi:hypothetical protein